MKKLLVGMLLLTASFAQAEYKTFGRFKSSIVNMGIDDYGNSNSITRSEPVVNDVRLGLKGFIRDEEVIYLYRLEFDIDSGYDNSNALGLDAKSSYFGVMNQVGIFIIGKLASSAKRASVFLDSWQSAKIDPFGLSLGYIPDVPEANQALGSKSLLELVNNSVVYISPKVNNIELAAHLNPGTSNNPGNSIARQGFRANYRKGDLMLSFANDNKSSNLGRTVLNLISLQYRLKNYIFGLSINSGTKNNAGFNGSYLEIIYKWQKFSFRYGKASFNHQQNLSVSNSGDALELGYDFNKIAKLFIGNAKYQNKINSLNNFSTNITSFGAVISF